jgi:hypothetical protein
LHDALLLQVAGKLPAGIPLPQAVGVMTSSLDKVLAKDYKVWRVGS